METLTVIITAHKEANLLYPTFSSALISEKMLLEKYNVDVHYLLYLDRADQLTREAAEDIIASYARTTIAYGNNGDPGQARLEAIKQSNADYIALLDGDDLWSDNWLLKCWSEKERRSLMPTDNFIFSPEYNLIFGAHNLLVRQGDIEDSWFDSQFLRFTNYWDALCFAPRFIFLETPYRKNDLDSGFAHEDYMWACETLAKQIPHYLVRNTIHFKRRRSGSVSQVAEEKKVKVMFNKYSDYI